MIKNKWVYQNPLLSLCVVEMTAMTVGKKLFFIVRSRQ